MDRIIVCASSGITVGCLYYGYEKEKLVRNQRVLLQGEVLEIIKIVRFIPKVGWYVQVLLNNIETEYIELNSIEKALKYNELTYLIDFQIELNLLSFQLNKALDERNRERFFNRVERYNKLLEIKQKGEANSLQMQ